MMMSSQGGRQLATYAMSRHIESTSSMIGDCNQGACPVADLGGENTPG